MSKNIFEQIRDGEASADIVFKNEYVTAFKDIYPDAPVHILIIPNKLIPTVNDVTEDDEPTMGRLFSVAKLLAKKEGISENGYRLIVNCGSHARQEVYHLHMHLVGGNDIGPMIC